MTSRRSSFFRILLVPIISSTWAQPALAMTSWVISREESTTSGILACSWTRIAIVRTQKRSVSHAGPDQGKKNALSSFGQCFPNVYYGLGTARLSNSWETPGVKRNWIKRSGGRGEKNASQAGEDRGFVRSGLFSKRGNKNKTMGKFCRITRVTSPRCQGFPPLLFLLPTALAIFKTPEVAQNDPRNAF